MPLKKPGELFGAITPKEPSINVDDKFPHIKEEFNKVEELRKQIDTVSSSLNNSLTEVVDKNLNFLSNEYSEQLDKFNKRINTFKEEINFEVHNLKKSNQYLKTEIEIVEQRQNRINIPNIKEEVIKEVQSLLSGDVADNIKRLEEKIEVVRDSYQQTLNEGLLNEPPNVQNSDPLTPLDKDYVTLKEFQAQYKIFLNRIQQQLATVGGGGAVRIQDLDDVDLSTARVNNKFLKYDSASGKWVGSNASGGSGSDVVDDTTPQLGGNLDLNGKYITGTGGINVTGVVTATSFSGTVPSSSLSGALPALDGSALTGVVGSGSGIVIKDGGSTVGTAGTINFGDNLSVSPISSGIVTVTGQAGSGSTANVSTSTLNVVGVTTHNQDVQFPGAAYNILWDQATSKFKFDDSAQCVFGSASGGDMKLFHQSGNSTIRNETGQFRIAGNDIRLQTQNHSEDYIICTDGGAVQIFYNDAEKIATTNTGINVTGTCAATAFSGSGATLTALNASNLSSGTVPTARLGSGTANSTTYLRGDGSWQTVSAGTGLATRATNSATTGVLAQTASGNIDITTQGKTFSLLKVSIDAPAWVVLYVDAASRTADASRSEGVDPAPGSGVITEVSTTDAGDSVFLMSPGVIGWNNDSTPTAKVYAKVTNKRSSSGSNTITVTLTNLKLEA